jgi:hypothetical protein
LLFYRKLRVFQVFSFFFFFVFFVFFVFFCFFRFVSKQIVSVVSLLSKTESFDVSIEPKQTEDPPKQFEGEYIWVILRKFRVVSVCFGLLRNSSVCFGLFRYRFKTPKQTETN